MKVLFIGGTGVISSACSELAVSKGIELYHLNRGISKNKRNIVGVKNITADIRDFNQTKKDLEGNSFDVVVDWLAFAPEHIQNDIKLFSGKTKQFVFISSASAYQTPPQKLPVTEDTPMDNPFWEYSRNKIACENLLKEEYKRNKFPYTIVRPSHTYDKTLIPIEGGYTVLHRMKQGLPVVVHGDGTSLWTLTHHKDFAVGLVGLLGKSETINETYHITSDEWLSWNSIYEIFAKELKVTPKLVHILSREYAKYNKEIGDSILGDKMHSMIFDNTKIKKLIPEFNCKISFAQGATEIVKWYEENPAYQIVDERINSFIEKAVKDAGF